MAETRITDNNVPLEDWTPSSSDDHMPNSRLMDSTRKRASVLLGSAILQLPIWGFLMCYGVFQEYYTSNWSLAGDQEVTGVIGMISNGVIYLSMPFLFALFTGHGRWAQHRQAAALLGAAITCASFVLSSFSTHVWQLVATQGILSALGCALLYSPTTLSLGEWFNSSNRALAYGLTLSCKNIVGSACPFLIRFLLDKYGLRTALQIWTAITAGTSILGAMLVSTPPSVREPERAITVTSSSSSPSDDVESEPSNLTTTTRQRKIPWNFLRHPTIYIYSASIICQSAGYGIPQTYLNTYASEVTLLSQASATLMLALFNVPGIVSSSFFGYLSDASSSSSSSSPPRQRWSRYIRWRPSLSAASTTAISAGSSGLAAFLFWGLTSSHQSGMALLILFSVTFGFFAGGYSATWGGILNELEKEAAQRNEAIDMGMVYGLLNGARGIGYVTGGLAGVPLLRAGMNAFGDVVHGAGSSAGWNSMTRVGYETAYGPLIIFTGLSSLLGGLGIVWRWEKGLRRLTSGMFRD
ncbi:Major facilitator superfamily domain containing protein [Rhypophila sp. PSN 637]